MAQGVHNLEFEQMPEFEIFCQIVGENIGYMPRVKFDEISLSGHRVQIFNDPPGAEIYYSQRSLARYVELSDIFVGAKARNSPEMLASGLMVLRAGDALRQNAGQGLALMARGFLKTDTLWEGIAFKQILKMQMAPQPGSLADHAYRLTSLFFPLAHEIGHLPDAQAIGPKAIYSDAFFETYRINYERIVEFTGAFEYSDSLYDKQSPLNLATLRQEVVSDYFAVNVMSWLLARIGKNGDPFPLYELTFALFSSPLLGALQSICLAGEMSWRQIQEVTLAMHCRYSIVVDSVRSALKALFMRRDDKEAVSALIDECINDTYKGFQALYVLTWKAIGSYAEESGVVAAMNEVEILNCVSQAKSDLNRRVAFSNFLDVVASDLDGYSVGRRNAKELRTYGAFLRTFDTVLIADDGSISVRG